MLIYHNFFCVEGQDLGIKSPQFFGNRCGIPPPATPWSGLEGCVSNGWSNMYLTNNLKWSTWPINNNIPKQSKTLFSVEGFNHQIIRLRIWEQAMARASGEVAGEFGEAPRGSAEISGASWKNLRAKDSHHLKVLVVVYIDGSVPYVWYTSIALIHIISLHIN